MPQRWQDYLASTKGKERKSALQLLSEIVADGNSEFCDDALEMAAANGRADVDSLRQCYYMIAKKEYRPDPLKLSGAPLLNYNPNLSAYLRGHLGQQHPHHAGGVDRFPHFTND